MAVTFNVPKSPKRDIERTDTFMGVDLTNTGVSVDIYRSPNAPNMVRDVPGKVRKRTGYYKEVLFGKETNVNYAAGTSALEKEIHFSSSTAGTSIKLYDLIQTIKSKDGEAFTLYLEFDYKSEDEFTIFGMSVEASEEWAHFSDSIECASTDEFTAVNVTSDVAQSIYIKEFALMRGKDSEYAWSPAPKYFVERENNDPVYGCHYLRNSIGAHDGDRILNVNRALGTHDTYDTYTTDDTVSVQLYNLAEPLCNAQKVYVEFDYEVIGQVRDDPTLDFYIGRGAYTHDYATFTVGAYTEEHHASWSGIVSNGYSNEIAVYPRYTYNDFRGIKVKNFSVMYEKDDNYTWSPAPEDNDEKFYIKDMYSISPMEYSSQDYYYQETPSGTIRLVVQTPSLSIPSKRAGSYEYISFDLTTALTNDAVTLEWVSVSTVLEGEGSTSGVSIEFTEQLTKKHFDIFRYTDTKYIDKISVAFAFSGGSSKAQVTLSNISIKNFTIRNSFVSAPKWFLYHVGKEFYLRASDSDQFTSVYSDANEHISKSWQLKNNSYIIDGKDIYMFSIEDGENLQVIGQDNAYIPVVTIAKEPSGGGTSYRPLNLLQPGFYELFQGAANVKEYQLSFKNLDDTLCEAWTLDSNANWNHKTEGTDFSVNRETGKITFTTAPGVSPITGEDNVKILAYRTVEGYRDRIVKCLTGVLFGVGGAGDRLFLTGNPEHPNWDFYSEKDDPTYFPDTGYSVMGSEQSRVIGYSIVSNYLAAFKDGFDPSQSVFIREGDLLKNDETGLTDPVFKLINTLQGEGAVAPYSFEYVQTEPLFLTKSGIYAITEQDITGEKYSQNRSFYLDGVLRKEDNLENAQSVVYDNQYILALNNKLFILDGLQATRTDKSEPYATRQYAGFLCEDIPAVSLWTDEGVCFGTHDGRVCKFYTDDKALESYNDDGKAIYACWDTPDLDGKLFYKNKTFRYFAVRMMQAIKTSVKLYSRKFGVWTLNSENAWTFIKEQTSIQNALDFDDVDFAMFTFSVDTTEKVIHTKLRVKKVDKARFRIENDKLNEPFGISDLALEFIENGNYKG